MPSWTMKGKIMYPHDFITLNTPQYANCPDWLVLNPLVTNGFFHPYQMGECITILRGIRRNLSFLFHFSMKFRVSNKKCQRWDAAFCRLIWVRVENLPVK